MRFSDLPDYAAIRASTTPALLVTPYDLLGSALAASVSNLWSRIAYLQRTIASPTATFLTATEGSAMRNDLNRMANVLATLAYNKNSAASAAVLFEHCSYQGWNHTAQIANPPISVAVPTSVNDAVSSLKVGPGVILTVSEHIDDQGWSYQFGEGDVDCLVSLWQNLNDQASSYRLESVQSMSTPRKADIVAKLANELYKIEVQTTWVTGEWQLVSEVTTLSYLLAYYIYARELSSCSLLFYSILSDKSCQVSFLYV
jgi:hypothetical protein